MKTWLIVFIQILNFMTASVTGGKCPETLQECFNCKAAAGCAPYREIRTVVSKDRCIALLENAGNTMVEYERGPGICKAFNCQYREEAQDFSTVIVSCRTDCPQYIIESRIQQSGSCDVTSQFATSSGLACLQFCLHRDGCLGVTHQVYPNDVNICTFHTCSSSVFESVYSSTFVGIKCTAVQGEVASSTYISTSQAEGLTQLQGNHTSVQNPVGSTTTFDETEETSALSQTFSRTVTFSSSEWTSVRESWDLRRLPTTKRHLNTNSNASAVLFTTTSSWAVSSLVGSVVTVLVIIC